MTPRIVWIFLVAFTGSVMPVTARAHPSTPGEHSEELFNIVSVGPVLAFHGLQGRNATERGAPEDEFLGGVMISYERILVPEAWATVITTSLLVNDERFDTPIDLQGKRIFALGGVELFVNAGITLNARLFRAKREVAEERSNDLTLGFIASTGLTRRLSQRVTVEAELGYGWIPLSRVVEHEVTGSLLTGYAF